MRMHGATPSTTPTLPGYSVNHRTRYLLAVEGSPPVEERSRKEVVVRLGVRPRLTQLSRQPLRNYLLPSAGELTKSKVGLQKHELHRNWCKKDTRS
jgi:hypothetical protein